MYLNSLFLNVASCDNVYLTTTRPIENKAMLIFFARGSRAEIVDWNMVVLHRGTCVVGCAEYCNTPLWCRSILTTERVWTSCGYKAFGQSASHEPQ